MTLTPLDLQHKEFGKGLRGYRETDVQDFLREVARSFEQLVSENAQLKEQLEALRQRVVHYEKMEETMHNALLLAQKSADESRRVAEKQADAIIRDAEERRRAILEDSRQRSAVIETDIEQLRQQRTHFEIEFTTLLRSHLERVEQRSRPMAEPVSETVRAVPKAPEIERAMPVAAAGVADESAADDDEKQTARSSVIDWRRVAGQ